MDALISTNTKSDNLILIMSKDEAKLIHESLCDYVKNNPKKQKVKKLLQEFDERLEIY